MAKVILETTDLENKEIEKYLSDSILSYGIEQMNGEKPIKAYCSFKDEGGNIIGSIMGYKTLNLFFITSLYVESDNRYNGYGNKLLGAAGSRYFCESLFWASQPKQAAKT